MTQLVSTITVMASSGALGTGLVAGAFALGCRHGLDVDHLSAITDLSCTQTSSRRSMILSSLYVAGHALVVLAFGLAAIALGVRLPEGVDDVMGVLVGLSLMALAVFTLVSVIRQGGDFRPRSRWMLLIQGWAHVRARHRPPATVVITHDHPHGHDHDHHAPDEHEGETDLLTPEMAHQSHALGLGLDVGHPDATDAASTAPTPTPRHRHLHRHVVPMPVDPLPAYGSSGAFGLGALHGVGAETPTQVLILVAAAGYDSTSAGLVALVAFVGGLVVVNTLVATGATYGFAGANRNRWLLTVTSIAVAVASFVVGAMFLLGRPLEVG